MATCTTDNVTKSQSESIEIANLTREFTERYYSTPTNSDKTLKDFVMFKIIGKGAFATVYFAVDALTKEKSYAMKVLNKEKVIKDMQVEHVKSEKRLLSSLRSDFIIALYHSFQDQENLYLALEFAPGGELFKLIRSRLYFSEESTRFYSMQMILAIEYLHRLEIVFRDIKPENVLITGNGYLKLADFGFAKLMLSNRTYTLCGTPEYLAPETILNRGYGRAVDWWAIGVFIYELLSGHTPFYHQEIKRIYEKIVLCKYKFPVHLNHDAKSLIKKLLEPDLTKRLGNLRRKTDDIKTHKWFMENNVYSWNGIHNQAYTLPKEVASYKIPLEMDFLQTELTSLKVFRTECDASKELFRDF